MENRSNGLLGGCEIHGFRTMEDLDIPSIMKEAKSRWLRPNEIHAILFNYTYFDIHVKPVSLPKGGTIVLFDRKKLRNFRKDGHNWKKKKDGKTVKEAHEHLKVGTEERIHVYYAHGEDSPNFVRRCYWLLDKALEHIVLVHYRETQEASSITPVDSGFRSDLSEYSASQLLSRSNESLVNQVYYPAMKDFTESGGSIHVTNHEIQLHEINTLDWDELLASNDLNEATFISNEKTPYLQQDKHPSVNISENNGNFLLTRTPHPDLLTSRNSMKPITEISSSHMGDMFLPLLEVQTNQKDDSRVYNMGTVADRNFSDRMAKDDLLSQDSLGRWMNEIIVDSPESVNDPSYESSVATSHGSIVSSAAVDHEGPVPAQIFCITDLSPSWAYSTEETKILVVGFFHQEYRHLAKSTIYCVCGDTLYPAEIIQVGVFRCLVSPHSSGSVNFYLSIDGKTPISQIITFEFRASASTNVVRRDKSQWNMFRIQIRLAHLLYSTSKSLDILSSKISPSSLKEGKKFALKYCNLSDSWAYFSKLIESGKISFDRAKDCLFELSMKSRLKEWLLERVVDGSKITERDTEGQGVLHLCAILGYTWAVYPFSCCGLSLDFRDKFGWTALHWAAYYGREKMVAALLSAGAKPNLVTDPTSDNPGGCTAADVAAKQGFEGLAAYLSEKSLVQQFEDMKIAGNAGGSLETHTYESPITSGITEEDLYLKDTLAAYRTAADAAARIQVAFRETTLKQRTKAVEGSNPELEARYIVAAMKIQHAYRNYEVRKQIAAAARIQYRFRTWKLRKDFLNKRRQAIKIQAIFRGFQVRREYRKITWSVGVLEKAILRWRRKRRGFCGLKVEIKEPNDDQKRESDTEEDFYRASRKQAEERVEKAVVRVQSMFRSKQAQQEYRRMKLAHTQAQLGYGEAVDPYDFLSEM
ncbi:calmodulin-binding transcription activator 6 isoform X2 [Amaranthus tricolor]|uniref:calmodulin-binding transcription activator 6 isoform X2 n=1 Tax=Amaranthus tricolor TaxID=29722 RepID=UPI002588E102|nr:calmodulin-binding transcription activator 6 isoform X2 [Amaranthus tricolor]XP_057546293.1 calmodulin-binding transcription activator 6 isoform X2 [Amaranthus tricolor]XP_057546294.1 calmodulin-binding transcription activator 6 isoform X2 [Amaranthus tricolor]